MDRREKPKPADLPKPGATRARDLGIAAILVLATAAVYCNVRHFESISFDDPGYVFTNKAVQSGLTSEGFMWALTTTRQSNWHPLTWMSHMADCQVFGPHVGDPPAVAQAAAGWHHLTSLLLHLASTVLLFFVLKRMTRAVWASAMVAAFFALHPLHVESVAWIAERKDVLSMFFGVLTLGAYALYAERPSVGRYLPVCIFLALGLMAKPMLVTLPLVMLLLDWWPLGRLRLAASLNARRLRNNNTTQQGDAVGRRPNAHNEAETACVQARTLQARSPGFLLVEKLPLFALAAASAIITYIVQRDAGSMVYGDAIPLGLRMQNALAAYVGYLGKAFRPTDLSIFYSYPPTVPLWPVYAAILAGITLVVFMAGRSRPYLAVGWLWFLGTLVPVIGLVQVGGQAMADRYTYLPLIGVFIAVVWGVRDVLAPVASRRYILGALAGGSLAACLVLTSHQVQVWANSFELFAHAVEVTDARATVVTERNALAHHSLGDVLMEKGMLPQAVDEYKAAIEAHPVNFPFAHHSLGLALYGLKQYPEAMQEFRLAIQDDPRFAGAYVDWGRVLISTGQPQEAAEQFRKAISLDPGLPHAHYQLGRALALEHKFDEAAAELRITLKSAPGAVEVMEELALVTWRQGNPAAAAALFRQALALRPDSPAALGDLAWMQATSTDDSLRSGADAVRGAERLVALRGRTEAVMLDTLAAAYAEAGRFDDAVRVQREAIALVATADPSGLRAGMEKRLALYQAGKPYREAVPEVYALPGQGAAEGKAAGTATHDSPAVAVRLHSAFRVPRSAFVAEVRS